MIGEPVVQLCIRFRARRKPGRPPGNGVDIQRERDPKRQQVAAALCSDHLRLRRHFRISHRLQRRFGPGDVPLNRLMHAFGEKQISDGVERLARAIDFANDRVRGGTADGGESGDSPWKGLVGRELNEIEPAYDVPRFDHLGARPRRDVGEQSRHEWKRSRSA